MDPAWDHTENEDKHLLAHTLAMDMDTNLDSVVYGSEVRSMSGIGCSYDKMGSADGSMSLKSEYGKYLSSVFLNSVNTHAKQQLHDPYNIFSCYILLYSYIFLLVLKCSLFSSFLFMACLHIPALTRFLKSSTQSNVIELWALYCLLRDYYKMGIAVGGSRFFSKLIRLSSEFVLCCNAHLSIIGSNLVITSLSEYLYRCIEILEILNIGTRCCCCICCYECSNKKVEKNCDQNQNNWNCNINNYQYYVSNVAENHGNNMCLCLVTKYVLVRNVKTLVCYIRDIVEDLYSSVSRRFDKYTHSNTHLMSVGKIIMLLIKVIYKITTWMKLKYLCTCRLFCPCCCPTKGGPCTCQCQLCSQPPTKCCECPKEPNNCTTNGNSGNNCCCKCKNGNSCSSCCSGTCGENKCCRCCCNCFCKNYQDPRYPYLISIILYVSSLMENIWSMDTESVRIAIENLSTLYSQLESYDLSSVKDTKNLSCNSVYSLVVNKECQNKGKCECKPGEKCCCWCITCFNLVVMCVSLCLQYKLCKAICNNTKKQNGCDKVKEFCKIEDCKCQCPKSGNGMCCLVKLALCSQVNSSGCEELQKVLQECCEKCQTQDECCKKILENVKAGKCKLLLVGCCCNDGKCGCNTDNGEVKGWCLMFNNPWGSRSVAVVVFCKCAKPPNGCCCLNTLVENFQSKITQICEGQECCCKELKSVCEDLCCKDCEGVCKELKDNCKAICGENNNCVCKLIDDVISKCCKKGTCPCSKSDEKGCCRCVCCKLVGMSLKILVRACRANVLDPYKRIVLELLNSTKNHEDFIRTIVEGINGTTLNNIYLLKNSYSSYPYSVGTYAGTINGVTNVETRNWGYDTKYEHDVSTDKGFRRGDGYPNILSDPRYTLTHPHLCFIVNYYPHMCIISISNQ